MIRIIQTNDKKLNRNYNDKWRESHDAQINLSSKISPDDSSAVPQSDVDAIADMMDGVTNNPNEEIGAQPQQPLMSPKDHDIAIMMQNYIRQNGGVVIQDKQEQTIVKNRTLLG